MILKAPKFWYKSRNELSIPSLLLTPLSKFWEFGYRTKTKLGSWEKMPIPVICVGNIIIGGSGKTPVTQALIRLLKELGYKPHVLSRGHGGKLKGPVYVSSSSSHVEVGDEPILLSKTGHVLISKNKKNGVHKAWENGADLVVLDDGLQNRSIAKDLSLVVVDSRIMFGNQRLIPSGPLREPIISGLSRYDAIILVEHDTNNLLKPPDFKFPANIPIIRAEVKPSVSSAPWKGQKVFAFSGIAHPEKFLATLKNLGCKIVGSNFFSDHYPFKNNEIKKLKLKAESLNAKLVTTEKDYVRIPFQQKGRIENIPIHIIFENKSKRILKKILLEVLLKK